MPSFDSDMDEVKNRYGCGYDLLNHNVPEGCYSSNPADPYSRIKEFKEMILNLHRNGFRVVMDVVFNHTSSKASSNFDLCYPRYFYRMNPDGSYSNGSGCGNEIAIRKAHKAFHIGSEQAVRNAVQFFAEDRQNIVAFRIDGDSVGDSWKNIYVIFNGSDKPQTLELPANKYVAVVYDGFIRDIHINCNGTISVPYLSAMILHD